jgi:eukaryotic-like serine/threonine-protein kinase
MDKVSLRADIRLLRLAIERGLLSWEDLEAVPQPTEPGRVAQGAAWGPWISRLIESGHLDETALVELIRKLDPEADEPLATPEEPRAPVPDNWDRYQIFSRLGSGGMGSVFKAFDPQLNRFVALKFIHTKDRKHARAFLDEARSQAQVEHPLICQVYEVGEVDDQPYIAMRFIDGQPLMEVAAKFPLANKIRLVQQVTDALQAAHQKGLIHRDIKPGNILVTTNAKGALRCIVVDFGLAQTLDRRGDPDEIAGTPDYLSPEQLRGDPVDHRTDIYSLGTVFYELLTGKLPLRGRNISETLRLIAEGEPAPPSSLSAAIPRDLDAIVLKCLAKEPSDRYTSAANLLRDLERFLAGEPIRIHSEAMSYRARKWLGRHRWVPRVAGVAALVLLALGSLSLQSQRQARRRAELARRFGEEVKEMEAAMRYATLLPAHSMAPHRAQLDQQIERLQAEMETLGPLARGPGQYALGRAYLAQHRYELAKEHLERAWQEGYRGPEVAAALGGVIGQLYEQATYASPMPRSSVLADATRDELIRVFRDPALEYLKAGRGDSSGRYIDALVAFYEGRFTDAVAAAEEAYAAKPWLYEARMLVGRVHEARGQEATHGGDYAGAVPHFAAALEVYEELTDVARSDAEILVAECHCLVQRNEARRYVGDLDQAAVDGALGACDAALRLDPDYSEALSLESRIHWHWADLTSRRGTDPTAELQRAIDLANAAIERNPRSSAAQQNLSAANRLLGSWQMLRGIDPVPALERAIAAAEAAIERQPDVAIGYNSLGNAHILLADQSIGRGADPEASIDKAIASYAKAIDLNSQYTPAMLNLGSAWTTRADWELSRGVDPTRSIEEALVPLQRAVEINPNYLQLHNNLGNAQNTLAVALAQRGEDPTARMDAAAASYRRALEIEPEYAIGLYNLAFVERQRAQYLLESGSDPTAAEAESDRAIREAIRINPSDPENFIESAELDLFRAHRDLLAGSSPEAAVETSKEAIQRARALNSDEPELYFLEALGHRYLAEWRLTDGGQAAVDLARGLQLADQAIALNPKYSESIALQGVLLKLQSRLLDPPRRAEVARRALEALQAALAANPALQHQYARDLIELRQILGDA